MMPSGESFYLNTGSCVHPSCITCIEVQGETLTLAKWYMGVRQSGTLYVERETLAVQN